MGFFNFLKEKEKTTVTQLEDVLLSNQMQKEMYYYITKIRHLNESAGTIPTQNDQMLMMNTIKSAYENGKKISYYLKSKGLNGARINSEILVTAFYFSIDLGLKNASDLNEDSIKDMFSLISFGSAGVYLDPQDVPDFIVAEVKEIINWLISHPAE